MSGVIIPVSSTGRIRPSIGSLIGRLIGSWIGSCPTLRKFRFGSWNRSLIPTSSFRFGLIARGVSEPHHFYGDLSLPSPLPPLIDSPYQQHPHLRPPPIHHTPPPYSLANPPYPKPSPPPPRATHGFRSDECSYWSPPLESVSTPPPPQAIIYVCSGMTFAWIGGLRWSHGDRWTEHFPDARSHCRRNTQRH